MKIAVIGFGLQGQSAVKYYQKTGHQITVCDKNPETSLPEGVNAQLGEDYLANLDTFDVLVRSPSIHPKDIQSANQETPEILNKVTTNTNEFFRVCPTKNIIGVTGTKGKGTTATLIGKMLEAAGFRVHLGGNIGTPPLDMLPAVLEDDWVVLELANFQLIDIKHSPKIAVCVMVEPEHQDWHQNLNEYIETKQQLFRWQTKNDIAVYNATNAFSQQISQKGAGKKIPYGDKPGAYIENQSVVIDEILVCKTSEIGLLGSHNQDNVCAALTASWQVSKNKTAFAKAIRNVKNLPFRMEFRKKINGVSFYNDSFASAPGATSAAIESIEGPKIVLIGGRDRGLDLKPLADSLSKNSGNIKQAILYGESAQRTFESLNAAGFKKMAINSTNNFADVINQAYSCAQPGDAVILSPGFPSFDMFDNFSQRGEYFNEILESLV